MRFGLPVAVLVFLAAVCGVSQTVAPPQNRAAAIGLEQQGQLAQAESAWRDVLKTHPLDAEAYAHLALLEAHQEHYKEAIPLYRKALAINPDIPGLRLDLGLSLFKSGAMKEAIVTFTPLLKSAPPDSPEEVRLSTLIGMAHFGLGEYGAAVPYLKKATKSDPTNLGFRMVLAQSCLSSKQYQCVLDVYREIVNLNAESAEADMLAGEALDEMQNHSGAIEQFRAAVKANPRQPNAHFGLGYLLWTQNQFEEAATEFQAELENFPRNAQALAYLADCNLHLNRTVNIRPLLETALKIDPSLAKAHLDLGILDAQDGRLDDSLREFTIAARISPNDPDVHWRLARLYQSMGRKAEAKIEFDKTNRLHKAESDTIASKLKAAQNRGNPTEAAPGGPPAN